MRNVPQTAACARRVVCRALTVLGGAAAGTALAWLLSSGSASAEVQPPLDEVPTAVAEVGAPVARAVDGVQELWDPPRNPSIADLQHTVNGTLQTDREVPELPACTACTVEQQDHQREETVAFDNADLPTTAVPTPVATPVAPGVAVVAAAPGTAKERAFADGMSRRAGPELTQAPPARPDGPGPLPATPAGIPTTGSQASTGNAVDSHLFMALPWQNSTTDHVAGAIAAATGAATLGRPNAQPGVVPD